MNQNLYYRHRFPAAIISHCVWQALESLAVLNERRHAPACNSFSLEMILDGIDCWKEITGVGVSISA